MQKRRDGKWVKLRAGDYSMHIWSGSDQVTFRATREPSGWVLRRSVGGAASKSAIVLADDLDRLRDAIEAADLDFAAGLS